MLVREPLILDNFFELLFDNISLEDIIAFKASSEAQARVHELLDKNNAGTLTTEEHSELERTVEVEQFVGVLKAKALKVIESKMTIEVVL